MRVFSRRVMVILLLLASVAHVCGASYEESALAKAKAQRLTAVQIAAKTYREIAALAGARVAVSGDSPVDFHWENVRNVVASQLASEEREAAIAADVAALKAMVSGAEVELDESGTVYRVRLRVTTAIRSVAPAEEGGDTGLLIAALGGVAAAAGAAGYGYARRRTRV